MKDGNQEFKRDAGKTRYDLVPWRVLRGLAQVLTFGARKYEPYGWQKVELHRYIAGGNRHFEAQALEGEAVDPESGLLHAWHYLACHMFVAWKMAFRPEEVYAYTRQQDFEGQEPRRRVEYGGEILCSSPSLGPTPATEVAAMADARAFDPFPPSTTVVDPMAPEWPVPRGEAFDILCEWGNEPLDVRDGTEGAKVLKEQFSGHQPPTGLVEAGVLTEADYEGWPGRLEYQQLGYHHLQREESGMPLPGQRFVEVDVVTDGGGLNVCSMPEECRWCEYTIKKAGM